MVGGLTVRRWPRWAKVGAGLACAFLAVLPLAGLAGARGARVSEVASFLGGVTILEGLLAVFLVSVALGAPKRSIRASILVFVLVVAGGVVMAEGASPLLWRYGHETMWANRPDGLGRVRQSTGTTCAAASGAMLLDRYGIEASEGDVAYAAGTSFFGTDQFELAQGLGSLASAEGRAAFATYDECVALGRPFIAYIRTDFGRHAILVDEIDAQGVVAVDPQFGGVTNYTRSEFERVWSGIAVWVDRPQDGERNK